MSFSSLGLSAGILSAVEAQGYSEPTPIQAAAIPAVLAGKDVMATAQTGTGKTAAFTLPVLHNLGGPKGGSPRVLVLTPTRELAGQVVESIGTYGKQSKVRTTSVYGGMPIGKQIGALKRGVDVLVATPGRLMDHMERGTVDLSQVETVVLDEADRMLDMGFIQPIEKILRAVPSQRQTLLFSATFSKAIRKLAERFLNDPERIEMARPNAAAEGVTQSAYLVDGSRKRDLLTHLIGSQDWGQVLVFTRTKRGADKLAEHLERQGVRSTAIHGDKTQGARTKALSSFKRQKVQALVATDVAARGLDIDSLPHVVNYELPDNAEDYVHRIGRTGRGGAEGTAISLVCADERRQLNAIERVVECRIPTSVEDGFEPTAKASSGPRRNGPNKGPQGQNRGNGQGRSGGRNNGDRSRGGQDRRRA
ncbi:MAG: DEAD/DEAH box helicase [Thiohalorhabdus sp.]|uniref:DEAD/DEAH box helicase n=1 Tax=Thiohalorhabdus sp. TaxID=3094134 RepID=UPI0039809EA7